jgi:hypothetical protein
MFFGAIHGHPWPSDHQDIESPETEAISTTSDRCFQLLQ